MPKVYQRYTRYLTNFRNLPNGGIYYLRSDGSGPHVRQSMYTELATTDPVTTPAGLAVAPSVRVQVVEKVSCKSQNLVV